MTDALWRHDELKSMFGASSAPPAHAVNDVAIDSRTLTLGDLFFAIKGDVHDGHDHVGAAFKAGAGAAVVATARATELTPLGPCFVVDDVLQALERLGMAARARTRARIAAVTGSVGKTSAKEMLRTALAPAGVVHASPASFNNHWGVPLTLARLPRDVDFGVFEIGMNHSGEITPLARFVRPHAALVTTIAPVHIEHLGSIEAIAEAKAELFEGLEVGGVAVLNHDAPQFELLRRRARARGAVVRTFGASEGCDAKIVSIKAQDEGSHIRIAYDGRSIDFDLGAPGEHMAHNAAGVLLIVEALGVAIEAAAAALAEFRPQKGRGARKVFVTPDGPLTLIDESYNANPASMRAALALLGATPPGLGGRRIAILGDMLELGADGAGLHAELAQDLSRHRVDLLFGAGPLTRALYDAASAEVRGAWAPNSDQLRPTALAALRGGDVVMVKGSNGSRMAPIVQAIGERFSRSVGTGV